jgi:hypothetical protein
MPPVALREAVRRAPDSLRALTSSGYWKRSWSVGRKQAREEGNVPRGLALTRSHLHQRLYTVPCRQPWRSQSDTRWTVAPADRGRCDEVLELLEVLPCSAVSRTRNGQFKRKENRERGGGPC